MIEVNVINLEGVIIEQIKLPTKTTPQCVSKFKYLYNHAIQGIKVYDPNNYIDYKLYVDNFNDSIFYLVDPKSNITLDYATFQLTIELPVNSTPTPPPTPPQCYSVNKPCVYNNHCIGNCVCVKDPSQTYGKCLNNSPAPTPPTPPTPASPTPASCSGKWQLCGPGLPWCCQGFSCNANQCQ